MKKIFLTLAMAVVSYCSYAQWSTGTDIYNTNTGNVGIGTASPSTKLHLQSAGTAAFTIESTGGAAASQYMLGSSSYIGYNNSLNLGTFSSTGSAITEKLTILSSGNVGIGTTSPATRLDINGTAATPNLVGSSGYASFYQSGGSARITVGGLTSGSYAGWIQTSDGAGSQLPISLQPSGGNVGIGTTSPGAKLEIGSIANGLATSGSTTTAGIRLHGASPSYNTVLDMGIAAAGGTNVWLQSTDATDLSQKYDLLLNANGGNVAIGTTDPQGYKLAVNGSAIAESVTVKLHGSWPDYVFKPKYSLLPLSQVKAFINKNQHLPDMPSEQEVAKNGINLGEIVKVQTKKIEELTLYLMEEHDKNTKQEARIATLEAALLKLTTNR